MSGLGMRSYILFLCIFLGFSLSTGAQSRGDSTLVHKFLISYPINDTELHEDYHDNAASLHIIREYFKKSPRIDSIVIYSYSSPDGPYRLNKRLAEQRGERARKYLLEHLPPERNFPDSLIVVNYTAENWDGLYEMVFNRYPYSDRREVLDLIGSTKIPNSQKKELLKKLNDGRPWRYIKAKILPHLRYATWVAEWVYTPISRPDEVLPHLSPVSPFVSDVNNLSYPVYTPRQEAPKQSKTILALKSNLLYDVATILNYTIEIPFGGNRFSALFYHQFPWWKWGESKNEYCARFLSLGGEFRWWINSKQRLNGHFLGLYAESGKYDFQYKRDFCYQGEFYSAGLSYGYSLPVGKHLNFEFSISAGYASIPYRGYTPSENYEILWRNPEDAGRIHYFGPTKVQVALVVPIVVNYKKGGNK